MLPGALDLIPIVVLAAAPAPTADPALEVVVLQAREIAGDELVRDLELRSPGLAVALQAPGAPPGLPAERRWAYVLVRADGEGAAITVILADGRAFDRRVTASADQVARAAASALANLLAAIAEDRVAPDRQDVTPTAALAEGEAIDPARSEPEPEPASELPPAPASEPDVIDPSAPPPATAASPAPPADAPRPRLSLVPELAPLVALQLGPPADTGPFGGGGFALGLGLRTPIGGRVGLELRPLWNARGGLALHRYRVALRGGHELRRGRFALVTDALVGVEPWLARHEGRRIDVGRGRSDLAPALALAFALRVVPAVDLALARGAHPRLRLGLWTELAYAGVVDGGLAAARITLPADTDEARLRLGGLELSLGLVIAAPIDLDRR